jgi:hypothetical protein
MKHSKAAAAAASDRVDIVSSGRIFAPADILRKPAAMQRACVYAAAAFAIGILAITTTLTYKRSCMPVVPNGV